MTFFFLQSYFDAKKISSDVASKVPGWDWLLLSNCSEELHFNF